MEGGGDPASEVVGNSLAEVGGVTGVKVAILGASEDVDVVQVSISDGPQRGCQLLRGPSNPRWARTTGLP